jgi:hypothetical protein
MTVLTPETIEFTHPTSYRDELRAQVDHVKVLVIPERRYLAMQGVGAPGAETFGEAMAALYPVAYALHFALRRHGIEESIGALELLMWRGEPGPVDPASFANSDGTAWSWKLMLPIPPTAGEDDIAAAIDEVRSKKAPSRLGDLRVELWQEGLVAQTLHVGPYEAEAPTIAALHARIVERGLRARGCHHEIYLSDPNRTAPERLRTVIRQPVEWA